MANAVTLGRMPHYYPDFLVRLTDGSLYIVESRGSIGRMDIGWWRQQGRTLFRDLPKHAQNAGTGGGMF